MPAIRTAIPDFQLANPLYIGAKATFYAVDETGAKTANRATLYAAPTGAQTALNPQTFDSEGKLSAPVYIEGPVIAEVTGPNVASHDTGVINPRGTWRGAWAANTVYYSTDFVQDPVSGNIYSATTNFTSSASLPADISAGHLAVVVDQVSMITGGSGLAIKRPVAVATTQDIPLSGLPVIDDYQTVAGDRVLVKDAANPAKNGIWNAAAGAWTRATDADMSVKIGAGCLVYVIDGTRHHNKSFQTQLTTPFTLDVSPLAFVATDLPDSTIPIQFGSAADGHITTGIKGFMPVAFDCEIEAMTMMANKPGSIVIDLYKGDEVNFPPGPADTITASAKPTLSNAQIVRDTTLAGWDKLLKKGDVLAIDVLSVGDLQFVSLNLIVKRS